MTYIPSDPSDISSCSSLIDLLEEGLRSPTRRRDLLSDRDLIRQILNCILVRRSLHEHACQKVDKNRAAKARLFIVELMQSSRTIWRGADLLPDPVVYEEALSRTWKWFFENLCSAYEPEVSSFLAWFNSKLKFVIVDVLNERAIETVIIQPSSDDEETDPVEQIPDLRNDDSMLINDLLSLLQCDAGGQLRRSYMWNFESTLISEERQAEAFSNHLCNNAHCQEKG